MSDKEADNRQCDACGEINPVWFADNEVWNTVFPERIGYVCPNCFIKLADPIVPNTGWKLVPEVAAECTAPAPQPPMDRLPLLVDAVQKFLKHDGGPGSEDYNASEIYHARRSMQAAFGFRCPRCGETLPHLYDENCTDYRGEICER